MAVDYKSKYLALKEQDEAELKATVKGLVVQITEHNNRHEKDLRDIKDDISEGATAVKSLADHVAKQNGRIGKLERKKGKHIPVDSKTVTLLAVVAIVFMILVIAGKEGLSAIEAIFN